MASWTTPVQDLIQQFGPGSSSSVPASSPVEGDNHPHLWPLLEVLTVLPEEMGSRTLRLGANRRAELRRLFSASTDDVLRLLVSLCVLFPFDVFV